MTTETNKLNSRQHRFVINLFQGMSQTNAYINAGYNVSPSVAAANATDLLKNPKISSELYSLNRRRQDVALAAETADNLVTALTKAEKRAILAEIARARLVDFTQNGEPVLSGDTPNARAAREYYHRRRIDKDGNPIITKNIKLIDPVEAIREDNKMAGDYAPSKHLIAQRVVFDIEFKPKSKELPGGENDIV